MFKKTGIVVGVTFIFLAIVVYWVAGSFTGSDDKSEPVPVDDLNGVEVKEEAKKEEPKQKENVSKPATAEPVKETVVVEKHVVQEVVETQPVETKKSDKQVFYDIDEETLTDGNPVRTEVMVISKKKVVLMDSGVGTKDGKQLVYTLELMYGDDTLSFPTNYVTYKGLKVGGKLKVDYSHFTNKDNTEFPYIISIEKVK